DVRGLVGKKGEKRKVPETTPTLASLMVTSAGGEGTRNRKRCEAALSKTEAAAGPSMPKPSGTTSDKDKSRSASPEPSGASTSAIPPNKSQITPADIKAIHTIFESLRGMKEAEIFNGPVDRTLYPDYYVKIAKPTDLLTMDQRVLAGEFKSVQDVAAEMMLMVQNCRKYNGAGSGPTRLALTIKTAFNKQWKDFTNNRKDASATPSASQGRSGRDARVGLVKGREIKPSAVRGPKAKAGKFVVQPVAPIVGEKKGTEV
ncbi:hypothetical protein HK097_002297, partial [Rhizophlyctis rosea]